MPFALIHAKPGRTGTLLLSWTLFAAGIGAYFYVSHARHLDNMLELARVITLGALNRNESRGAHYKPDFPNRDDENFLKTTIAEYSGEGPVLSYDPVDVSLIKPRKRDYSHEKKETAKV